MAIEIQDIKNKPIAGLKEADIKLVGFDNNEFKQISTKNLVELNSKGKIPPQYLDISDLKFLGVYDAENNVPGISDNIGYNNEYYIVNVPGNQNFGSGNLDLKSGDYLIFYNGVWNQVIQNQSSVFVNTIDDLRNLNAKEGDTITLLGYYVSGDKDPLNYKFTITDFNTNVDDGGSIIKSSKGSWMAQFSNTVRTSMYGGSNGFASLSNIENIIVDNVVDLYLSTELGNNINLIFEGGCFKNGKLIGDNNIIFGLSDSCFENVDIEGNFICETINHKSFINYENDLKMLTAIFNLGFSGIHSTEIDLGARQYDINSTNFTAYTSIWKYDNVANKSLINENTIFNDLRNIQNSLERLLAVITFESCSNITIKGSYINKNVDINLATELGYKGYTFIQTYKNCSNFDVNIKIQNARFGIRHGDFNKWWLNGDKGLSNSNLNINSESSGYPISIELGEKNSINVLSNKHHRAVYSCGLSESDIFVKGKDIYIAPAHCLISDTRYSLTESGAIFYKAPSDLRVTVEDTGTTFANNSEPVCVIFQTYGFFNSRNNPLYWKNIIVNIFNESSTIGDFSFTRSVENIPPFNINDTFENINIVVIDKSTSTKHNRIVYSNHCVYKNFTFSLNTPNRSLIVDNAYNVDVIINNSNIGTLYFAGKVFLNNTSVNTIGNFTSNIGVSNKNLKLRVSKIPFISPALATTVDSDFSSYRSFNANQVDGTPNSPLITYDETSKRPKVWNLNSWVDIDGRTLSPLIGINFPWTTNSVVVDRGYLFYRSDQNKVYVWTASGWRNLLQAEVSTAVANVTATDLTTISISDLTTISTLDATDATTTQALVNELKAKLNLAIALINDNKSKYNTGVVPLSNSNKSQLNAKLASDRASGQQTT